MNDKFIIETQETEDKITIAVTYKDKMWYVDCLIPSFDQNTLAGMLGLLSRAIYRD